MEMALINDCQPAGLATCAVCFRELRLDERGRLFRHVYQLGFPDRCEGSKYPPAGTSLYGTRLTLDHLAGEVQALQQESVVLQAKPLLDGIGPFDAMYEARWYQASHFCELKLKAKQLMLDRLAQQLKEWIPSGPILGPDQVHKVALWQCRAGTSVPLCFSGFETRPRGEPILVVDASQVTCSHCIQLFQG